MARKSDKAKDVANAQLRHSVDNSETGLSVIRTPHEVGKTASPSDRLGVAVAKGSQMASRAVNATNKATVAAAKMTAEATGRAASATAQTATAAAKGAVKTAKTAGKAIGRSAGSTAKASASAVANMAASATQASVQAGGKVATAAVETFHFVADLNGDGRFDTHDLRIAKAAVSKVAVELGGEAVEMGKAAMRHQLVRDAAAGALVGGAVASAVPLVGIPFGAAVGAGIVLARGAGSEMIGMAASGAAGLANQALQSAAKPKAKRSRAKPKPKPKL